MWGLTAYSMRLPPKTPVLRPPTAITVTLHPWEGVGKIHCEPVDIPPEMLDLVLVYLTPYQYFEGEVNDFITKIVAEVVLTHENGTQTFVMVRDHGRHNPPVVSVDGKRYFYVQGGPGVGARELIRWVSIAQTKNAQQLPKP